MITTQLIAVNATPTTSSAGVLGKAILVHGILVGVHVDEAGCKDTDEAVQNCC